MTSLAREGGDHMVPDLRHASEPVKALDPREVAAAIRAATRSNVRGALEGLINGYHPLDLSLIHI